MAAPRTSASFVTRAPARGLVTGLFLLSGASGLAYQIVWVRMLVVTFGTSVFAVGTVLAAFMAGLALGALLLGRLADRLPRPLRLYAALELAIALVALALLPAFAMLDELYTSAYRTLGQGPGFVLFRFAMSFLVLLVPTTLMGGTLPALSRFAARHRPGLGRAVGALYAANTIGAAAGSVLVAFLLLPHLGVRATVTLAAGVNAAVAAMAFAASRVLESVPAPEAPAADRGRSAAADGARRPATAASPLRLVYWSYGISGFAALGYEVIWTRLLASALGLTTSQSLSVILVVFLFGLAAGGAVAARRVDRWPDPLAWFGRTELALGLSALISILVLARARSIVAALGPAWSQPEHLLRLFVGAAAVMALPTFLMGALFPLASKLSAPAPATVGRRIGGIYAANTAGAILGAFATAFALVPLFGTQRALILLAWINLGIGATVLVAGGARSRAAAFGLAALLVPALALTLALPPELLVRACRPAPEATLLFHDEGAAGTVTVVEMTGGKRVLSVNGAGEVPTDRASIQTFRLLGSLPGLLHPAAQDVLVIAFGGGITLAAVEAQGPRHVDCVELAPGVLRAAPWFDRYNARVFERVGGPGIEVVVDDGRNHVLRTSRSYDAIISDSTHPSSADSWVLYTREFYELCRQRLNEGGVMAQWLPLHGLSVEDYRTILRTFRSVFPHASVWVTPGYSVLLAMPERMEIGFEELARRLARPQAHDLLQEVDLGDPLSILAALTLDEASIVAYAGAGPLNTDDLAPIAFGDRSENGAALGLPVLASFLPWLPADPFDHLRGASPDERLALRQRVLARKHVLAAIVANRLGERARALEELSRAQAFDPSEPEARRLRTALEASASRPGVPGGSDGAFRVVVPN